MILTGVDKVLSVQLIENTLVMLDDNNVIKAYTMDLITWTATNDLVIDTTALKS